MISNEWFYLKIRSHCPQDHVLRAVTPEFVVNITPSWVFYCLWIYAASMDKSYGKYFGAFGLIAGYPQSDMQAD